MGKERQICVLNFTMFSIQFSRLESQVEIHEKKKFFRSLLYRHHFSRVILLIPLYLLNRK